MPIFGIQRDREPEPGRVGVLGRTRQDEPFTVRECLVKVREIGLPRVDELGQFAQLGLAERGLHVCCLQVVADVAVDVLVVVPLG